MAPGRTTTPPPLPGIRHRGVCALQGICGDPKRVWIQTTCPSWPTSGSNRPMCRCSNRLGPVTDPVRWPMIMVIITV
jgi:hypothetical protein